MNTATALKVTSPQQVAKDFGNETLASSLLQSVTECVDAIVHLQTQLAKLPNEADKLLYEKAIQAINNTIIGKAFLSEQVLFQNTNQLIIPSGITATSNSVDKTEQKLSQDNKKGKSVQLIPKVGVEPKKPIVTPAPKHQAYKRLTILNTPGIELPETTAKLMNGPWTESKIDEVAKSLVETNRVEDALNLSLDLFNANGSLGKKPEEVEKRFFFEVLPFIKGIKVDEPNAKEMETFTLTAWENYLNDIVELYKSKVNVIKAGVEDIKNIGCLSIKTQAMLQPYYIDKSKSLVDEIIKMISSESKVEKVKFEAYNEQDIKMLKDAGFEGVILSNPDPSIDTQVIAEDSIPLTYIQLEEQVLAIITKNGGIGKESRKFFEENIVKISESAYATDKVAKEKAWKEIKEKYKASKKVGEPVQPSGTTAGTTVAEQAPATLSKELTEEEAVKTFSEAIEEKIRNGSRHALNECMQLWKSLRKSVKSNTVKPEKIYNEIKNKINNEGSKEETIKTDLPQMFQKVDVSKKFPEVWKIAEKLTTEKELASYICKLHFEENSWNVAANLVHQTAIKPIADWTSEVQAEWFKKVLSDKSISGYNKAEEEKKGNESVKLGEESKTVGTENVGLESPTSNQSAKDNVPTEPIKDKDSNNLPVVSNPKYDIIKTTRDKMELKKTVIDFLKDRECSLEDRKNVLIDEYLSKSKRYKSATTADINNFLNKLIANDTELSKENKA